MYPKEIPDFIGQVMKYIEIGIERVANDKMVAVEPPAGVDPPPVAYIYPEHVELMLNVEAKIDDGTADDAYENQSIWVKIPWPKRIG